MIKDTIVAVASGMGPGALAVIRVSGPETCCIIEKVFLPGGTGSSGGGKTKFPLPSHLLCHGIIQDENGQIVDEVMCVVMHKPRSYTKEDVAEIYCHGGTATVLSVLGVLYRTGARPAEPGEFTKRAFLNGRIDLSQAEAVMELINAKSDLARRAGLRKLSGGLLRKVNNFRDRILTWLAHIELSVDYPEHEEEAMNLAMIRDEGQKLCKELKELRATARLGERIKTGIPTAIVGKPNVGKSSLMNAILQEDRAIVTDMPGTTRDTLTEEITVRNIPILLTDTAGIREWDGREPSNSTMMQLGHDGQKPQLDEAEQIGVERSKKHVQSAELVLHVIDRSAPLTEEDYNIAELLSESQNKGQKKIIVLNKSDLPPAQMGVYSALTDWPSAYSGIIIQPTDHAIEISARTGEGLDELYRIIEKLFLENTDGSMIADGDIITQARHSYLLDEVIRHLESALSDIGDSIPEDIISIDLKSAYVKLGEIIGEEVGDDVLDRIFEEFCVGK